MSGIVATVKLSGESVLDPATGNPLRNVRGDLIVRHEQESTQVPFILGNGDIDPSEDNFLVWLASMPSTGVTFRFKGFTSSLDLANVPDPLRLDWSLYSGGTCITDAEPIWEASTYWTLKDKREGLLVQVSNLNASSWLLKCAVADTGGIKIDLKGSFEYFCSIAPQAGDSQIITGPMVG